MGLVKIDDELHESVRRASAVMCRSINAQAEFWMKIGRLAEANPTLTFSEIVKRFHNGSARIRTSRKAGSFPTIPPLNKWRSQSGSPGSSDAMCLMSVSAIVA